MPTLENILIVLGIWLALSVLTAAVVAAILRATPQEPDA